MHELPRIIRDPQVLLALAPEELAAKLLPMLKARAQREKGLLPPLPTYKRSPESRPDKGQSVPSVPQSERTRHAKAHRRDPNRT